MYNYLPIQTFTGLACLLFVYLGMNYTTLIDASKWQVPGKETIERLLSWEIQVTWCEQQILLEVCYEPKKLNWKERTIWEKKRYLVQGFPLLQQRHSSVHQKLRNLNAIPLPPVSSYLLCMLIPSNKLLNALTATNFLLLIFYSSILTK